MSRSLRFIGFALIGWVGLRALSLGLVPGAEAFAIDRASGLDQRVAKASRPLPPLVATEFAPIEPVAPPAPLRFVNDPRFAGAIAPYGYAAYYSPPARYAARVHVAASRPAAPQLALAEAGDWSLDHAATERYAEAIPPLEQWPLGQIAGSGRAPRPVPGQSAPVIAPRLDRLSMSAWAMLRGEPGGTSLAANGMLGGSQAGARLLWRFNPRLAASLRTSAPIGGVSRGGEVAAGVRWQPLVRIPVAVTFERRQAFGDDDVGRSGFALFAEGGVYERPIAAGFDLDAYLQGGVVGVRDSDLFVDGSATLTRPLWRAFSGGIGVWGGAQPGVARLDAGPRLSWRVGRSMRVHVDYRHRLAGSAMPGSGPVVTIAGDF